MDSAYQTAKQARSEDDSRLSALQGIKAGLTGVQAWQAAQQGGEEGGVSQFFGISASLGSQKSSSKQTQEQSVSQGSSLTAGNSLNILATGSGAVGQDGDIRIQGSQLKAGNDMLLAANRDITLEAAANTQKLDGKNSSSGGSIGASLGYGSDGKAGLSIFASANQGSGKETGNGTTWSETTLDAGDKVSLVSGRDTSLKGAQVNGEQIIANVGRDLTLQSLQDSDYYDSKQKNVSAGASVNVIGPPGGGANFSASQSKIDSNYQSVQEQTGLYAGKGGFQIDVGNHTQLDGSVIASTAGADKNRLSTDTLGWSSLDNKADYKSQQQSVSVSSGNNGSGEFTSNMPSGMLVAYNHGDSASGTTNSAISNGTIEIRDKANQQQDVASLSRDVEHANGSISPIFDKEKEQQRLQQVQLIGEIGTQAMDIVRTQGDIEATAKARKELEKQGLTGLTDEQVKKTDAYKEAMKDFGTGGKYQQVAQAVTAALQGLTGGDIGSALAGASAPYLAHVIKESTAGNDDARYMAQAVLGAIVAQAQGNSAGVGAAGAVTGEYIASVITKQLYGNVDPQTLSEEQKQTVSALSTLAGGLVGGVLGGDAQSALAAAQAGKNVTENNFLGQSSQQARDYAQKAQLTGTYTLESAKRLVALDGADQYSDELLKKYTTNPGSMSQDELNLLAAYLQVYTSEQIKAEGVENAKLSLAKLLLSGPDDGYYPFAGSSEARDAAAQAMGVGPLNTREQSPAEQAFRDALGVIAIGNEQQGLANYGNQAIYLLGGPLGTTIRVAAAANGRSADGRRSSTSGRGRCLERRWEYFVRHRRHGYRGSSWGESLGTAGGGCGWWCKRCRRNGR